MNQSTTRALRHLFNEIPTFSVLDPRRKAVWRSFKKDYNRVPRPDRFGYLASLAGHVKQLQQMVEQQNAQQAAAASTQPA